MLVSEAKSEFFRFILNHSRNWMGWHSLFKKRGEMLTAHEIIRKTDPELVRIGRRFYFERCMDGPFRLFMYFLDMKRVECLDLDKPALYSLFKEFFAANPMTANFRVRPDARQRLHIAECRDVEGFAPHQWGYRAASKLPGKMFK